MWPFKTRVVVIARTPESIAAQAEEDRKLAEEREARRRAAEARILANIGRADRTNREIETRMTAHEQESARRRTATDTIVRRAAEHASAVLAPKNGKTVQQMAEEALRDSE